MTELLLMRHGKSSHHLGLPDFERPLTDRGKRDAQRVGEFLRVNHLIPEQIISSPATRALATAEKCIKATGLATDSIHTDSRIYEAGTDDLLDVVAEYRPHSSRLMIVGHNPSLEHLVESLVGKTVFNDKGMTTANVVHIDVRDNSAAPIAKVIDVVRPRDLPRTFTFEGPQGAEQRERPAYYYSQSGVIPCRRVDGQLEVLLITKRYSDKKRSKRPVQWSIPKGIVEPGLTPQASATKEAMEEAGVEGHVGQRRLGTFTVAKWGATCTVQVYAFLVTHALPDADWESRKRIRKWFSVDDAAAACKYPELGPMVRSLVDNR
ncbi:MAG: NUDIX domain-containing protein [Pseudomonadota bacterium]